VRLLRVGVLLLCDNTFMDGRIADPAAEGSDLRGMREFNRLVAADPRFVRPRCGTVTRPGGRLTIQLGCGRR
jgi:predicted O-methyltransferase YrrM